MDKFTTDRDNAIKWARKLLEHGEFVILDTETTGLDSAAEIMQFAFVNHNDTNSIQFDVCPSRNASLDEGAFRVHGITMEMARECPPITLWAATITEIIKGKTVIAWNASFDYRMLIQSFNAWQVEPPAIIHLANFECAMLQYSKFVGDWDARRGQYRWQKLPGATHSALDDCRATLAVLHQMAETRLSDEGDVAEVNTTIDYATETISQKLTFAEPKPRTGLEDTAQRNLAAVGVIVSMDEVNSWESHQVMEAVNWSYERRFKDRHAVRPDFLPVPTGPMESPCIDDQPESTSTAVEVDEIGAGYALKKLLAVAGEDIWLSTINAWSAEQKTEAIKYAADLAVACINQLLGQPFTFPTRPDFFPAEIEIPF